MPRFIKLLFLSILMVFSLFLSACGDDDVGGVTTTKTNGTEENLANTMDNAPPIPAEEIIEEVAVAEPDANKEVLGVGFVYVAPIEQTGWTFEHNQARLALDKLDGVITTYVENESTGPDAERAMQSMASKGYDLIIATSLGYEKTVLSVAAEYPEVKFLHCSGSSRTPNVSTYFGRMYEARYLIGMVAGAMSTTNSIGYVAAFPVPEVIRGINAFTLGVKESNPSAEVRVVWTRDWYNPLEEEKAVDFLVSTADVDVVAQHTDSIAPHEAAERLGIYSVGYHSDMSKISPKAHLVSAVWEFEPFYTDIVEKLKQGVWEEFDYWKGLDSGIVDISEFAPVVPQSVQDRVNAKKAEIVDGSFVIFRGPIYDQNGEMHIAEGESPDDQELLQMDWFVNGVLIPADMENMETQTQ